MKNVTIHMLFFLLFLSSCHDKKNNNVVLKIGDYEMTSEDYRYLKNSEKYKGMPDSLIHQKMINEGHILAFAIDKRYDTIVKLQKQLAYIEKFYASMVNGYVWNKKVMPNLFVNKHEIENAKNRLNSEMELIVVEFPEGGIDHYNNSKTKKKISQTEFMSLVNSLSVKTVTEVREQRMAYPFYPYGVYTKSFDSAKIGNIIGPISTLNGDFLIYVKSINTTEKLPLGYKKDRIYQELLNSKREKYIWESQKRIFKSTQPTMFNENINKMAEAFDANLRSWTDIREEEPLMEYRKKGEKKVFTSGDFKEFVQFHPVVIGDLSKSGDVIKLLRTHLIGEYLLNEAVDMGMREDSKFQYFLNARRNGVYVEYYLVQNIKEFNVSEQEIENFYKNHRTSFSTFQSATVEVFKFDDFENAIKYIDGFKLEKEEILRKSQYVSRELKTFNLENPHRLYPAELIEAISRLENGEITMPLSIDDMYWVARIINKDGSRISPLPYVKEKIRNDLLKQKERNMVAVQMAHLKKQYRISINNLNKINIQKDENIVI